MSTSSSSYGRRTWKAPRLCKHQLPAVVKTSHTEKNPFRRYYECRRRAWDDCGLWEWIDPELTPYYKRCIQELKVEKHNDIDDEYENLKCSQMDNVAMEDEKMKECADFRMKKMECTIRVMYVLFGIMVTLFLVVLSN